MSCEHYECSNCDNCSCTDVEQCGYTGLCTECCADQSGHKCEDWA